jgi:hypothetical protein
MKTKAVKIEGLTLNVADSLFRDKNVEKELKILKSRVVELEKALKRVGIIVY